MAYLERYVIAVQTSQRPYRILVQVAVQAHLSENKQT